MNNHSKYLILFGVCVTIVFTGVSCSGSSFTLTTGSGGGNSGVYKSDDKGGHWVHKVFVEKVKKKDTTIGAVNVKRIMLDSFDSRIVFLLTQESGIWKTTDGAERWRQIYPNGALGDLSIDVKSPNDLFVAAGNTLSRSDDGGTSWVKTYLESRPGIGMNAVLIDRGDARRVYAGTSAGDILLSRDQGATWQVQYRFENTSIVRMVQLSSRTLFAATPNQGLWRSTDQGATWVNTIERLRDKPGAYDVRDIVVDPTAPQSLFLITNYGIFKTKSAGDEWEEVSLIARPGGADIKSMAVNPVNSQELYYAVPGGMYRSEDGGKRWATLSLPAGNLPTALTVDWYNSDIVYLGMTKVKK